MKRLVAAAVAVASVLGIVTSGCGWHDSAETSGDARMGKQLLGAFGCGGCHRISDVTGADGRVGPSLDGLRHRRIIAGSLPNTPENLTRWINDPKAVDRDTLMPDLGVTRSQARLIAEYLYEH